jgi:hypothetical protein
MKRFRPILIALGVIFGIAVGFGLCRKYGARAREGSSVALFGETKTKDVSQHLTRAGGLRRRRGGERADRSRGRTTLPKRRSAARFGQPKSPTARKMPSGCGPPAGGRRLIAAGGMTATGQLA